MIATASPAQSKAQNAAVESISFTACEAGPLVDALCGQSTTPATRRFCELLAPKLASLRLNPVQVATIYGDTVKEMVEENKHVKAADLLEEFRPIMGNVLMKPEVSAIARHLRPV